MEIEEILKINSDFSELIKKIKWYSNIGISRQMAYNLKKRFLEGTVTPDTLSKYINKYKYHE
jgi:hypothetical protein